MLATLFIYCLSRVDVWMNIPNLSQRNPYAKLMGHPVQIGPQWKNSSKLVSWKHHTWQHLSFLSSFCLSSSSDSDSDCDDADEEETADLTYPMLFSPIGVIGIARYTHGGFELHTAWMENITERRAFV